MKFGYGFSRGEVIPGGLNLQVEGLLFRVTFPDTEDTVGVSFSGTWPNVTMTLSAGCPFDGIGPFTIGESYYIPDLAHNEDNQIFWADRGMVIYSTPQTDITSQKILRYLREYYWSPKGLVSAIDVFDSANDRGNDLLTSYAGDQYLDGVNIGANPAIGSKGLDIGPARTNYLSVGAESLLHSSWTVSGGTTKDSATQATIPVGGKLNNSINTLVAGDQAGFSVNLSGSGTITLFLLNTDVWTIVDVMVIALTSSPTKYHVKGTLAAGATSAYFQLVNGSASTVNVTVEKLMLNKSLYLYDYIPPGTTHTSSAATSSDNGARILMDDAVLAALRGKPDGVELWDDSSASGTNWSLSAGVWTHTVGNTAALTQSSTVIIGQRYRALYKITGVSAGSVTPKAGSTGTGGTARTANGTYTGELLCAGDTTMYFTPSSDFDGAVQIISLQKLLPAECTTAGKFAIGASSAEVTAPVNLKTCKNLSTGVLYLDAGGTIKTTDGTNTASVTVSGGWSRDQVLTAVLECTGTQMRVGYAKDGETTITWGTLVSFTGTMTPEVNERFGYSNTIPLWLQANVDWNASGLDDFAILSPLEVSS